MPMGRRVKVAGRRTRRIYLRLNECQYAGLRYAGVLSAQCVAEQALTYVITSLEAKARRDAGFRLQWDAECFRLAKEEMAR